MTAINLLTGKRPLEMHDIRTGKFEWHSHAPQVSNFLRDILDKAIEPDFHKRYQSPDEMKSALLVELKEQKVKPVNSFGEGHGHQIALPIASAIGRYADKITGVKYTKILFILSSTGLVQATYFENEADFKRMQNAESFIFFDPYEPMEAFYLEWKNVSKKVMERILNIEINIENFPENYRFRY